MIRKAAVAGYFYPGTEKELREELGNMIVSAEKRQRVKGLIVPHAGYVYSGACAGKAFGKTEITDCMLLLGINHRGGRYPFTLDGHNQWETPLGRINLDLDLRQILVGASPLFRIDSDSGLQEHSLEVQVPFVQYLRPHTLILPILVSSGNVDELIEAGVQIGRIIRKKPGITMVASTDMSHYISAEKARQVDAFAIEHILSLDPRGLMETVMRRKITMCGVAPTVVMLAAALEAGATTAEVVDYTNSGAVSGHFEEVVAYLSAIVQ